MCLDLLYQVNFFQNFWKTSTSMTSGVGRDQARSSGVNFFSSLIFRIFKPIDCFFFLKNSFCVQLELDRPFPGSIVDFIVGTVDEKIFIIEHKGFPQLDRVWESKKDGTKAIPVDR